MLEMREERDSDCHSHAQGAIAGSGVMDSWTALLSANGHHLCQLHVEAQAVLDLELLHEAPHIPDYPTCAHPHEDLYYDSGEKYHQKPYPALG